MDPLANSGVSANTFAACQSLDISNGVTLRPEFATQGSQHSEQALLSSSSSSFSDVPTSGPSTSPEGKPAPHANVVVAPAKSATDHKKIQLSNDRPRTDNAWIRSLEFYDEVEALNARVRKFDDNAKAAAQAGAASVEQDRALLKALEDTLARDEVRVGRMLGAAYAIEKAVDARLAAVRGQRGEMERERVKEFRLVQERDDLAKQKDHNEKIEASVTRDVLRAGRMIAEARDVDMETVV